MRKHIFLRLLTSVILAVFFSLVSREILLAQVEGIPPKAETIVDSYIVSPYSTAGIYLLSVFDKRGNVNSAVKIVLDEEDKEFLSDFSLFIPGKNIQVGRFVHEKFKLKQNCSPGYFQKIEGGSPLPQDCYENYISVFTTLRPKFEEEDKGVKVTFSAKPSLEGKGQESLLFSYRGGMNTKKILGSYSFSIATPQVPFSLATVQVGAIVKEGLTLRGAPSYYYGPAYIPSFKVLERGKDLEEEEDSQLSQLSSEIMYNGTIRKADSDLTAGTSFLVEGKYGSFRPALYLKEMAVAIFGVIFVIALLFLLWFKLLKKHSQARTIIVTSLISILATAFLALLLFLLYLFLRTKSPVPM